MPSQVPSVAADLDDPFVPSSLGPRATMKSMPFPEESPSQGGRAALPAPALEGPRPIREPLREFVMPVGQLAHAEFNRECSDGFQQGLVIVQLDVSGERARFFASLVVVDARGELRVLDTTPEMIQATAKLIGDDARSGNGRWRRLVVRIARTQRGASVDVKVTA
jgi:hypothetical protein